jgi:1-acyl-sn-glycerol-3-phosphate acyltransferase
MASPSIKNPEIAAVSPPAPPAFKSAGRPFDTQPLAYEQWRGASLLGYVRFAIRIVAMAFVCLICVPLYYVWRMMRLPNPWPRLFLQSIGFICGARVTTIGTPIRRDVFYIANHLSWLDIPIIGGRSGSAFVAKAEIAKWPFIGWMCSLNNTVFVSRADRLGVAEQINLLRDAMAETWSVTVFPEGTTTDGLTLLPFKSPLLQVLEPPPPGVLVQPVFIDYGEVGRDISWIGEESAQLNAWRLFTRKGSFAVVVHFLDPFDPHDHRGRKAIAAESRRRIADELSATLPGNPVL